MFECTFLPQFIVHSSSGLPGNMSNEYIEVEQQLRGSEALQMQLKEEQDRMHQSLQQQQIKLEEK